MVISQTSHQCNHAVDHSRYNVGVVAYFSGSGAHILLNVSTPPLRAQKYATLAPKSTAESFSKDRSLQDPIKVVMSHTTPKILSGTRSGPITIKDASAVRPSMSIHSPSPGFRQVPSQIKLNFRHRIVLLYEIPLLTEVGISDAEILGGVTRRTGYDEQRGVNLYHTFDMTFEDVNNCYESRNMPHRQPDVMSFR